MILTVLVHCFKFSLIEKADSADMRDTVPGETMPFLMLSILADVIATAALKSSEGFTRLIPTLIVLLGYGLGFYFLSLSLKVMPVGTAYAVASGLGTALIVLLGVLFMKEPLSAVKLLGLVLIVAGVVALNVVDGHSSKS